MPTRTGRPSREDQHPSTALAAAEAKLERIAERLRDAEQRLRDLLEGSVQGIMIHRNRQAVLVNPAFLEIFGYTSAAEAMAVPSVYAFIAPEDHARLNEYYQARIRGEPAPARYVSQGVRKDGNRVWLESVARVISWEGEPAVQITYRDITGQRRMEEALRRSEELFRLAFENAPVATAIARPGEGWVQVNDHFCEFFGRSREYLLNHPHPMRLIRETSHPADVDLEFEQYARLKSGEIDHYQVEKRYLRPDGTMRWGSVAVSVARSEGHGIVHFIIQILDITGRKQAEEALRNSETRFRLGFERAPSAFALLEIGVGYIQVNAEFCRFFGRPAEFFLNSKDAIATVTEITHPEDLAADMAEFSRIMSGEIDSYQLEKRYLRPGGEIRWGMLSVAVARTRERKIQFIISQIIDITDRKRAEEAAREIEERFRIAFEDAPLGIALGHPERGWVQINRAFADFLEVPREEMMGRGDLLRQISLNTQPDQVSEHQRLHERLVAGEIDRFHLEKRYVTATGKERWGSLHVAVTRNPDGTVRFIVSQRLDITDRKLAERAMRESEERFRAAFEHAPVGMNLATPDGLLQVNAAFAEMVGRSREELLAFPSFAELIRAVSHPDDAPATRQGFEKMFAGELEVFRQEKRYLRPDGGVRWGVVSMAPVRSGPGPARYFVTQIADITPLKLAQEALRESEERFRIAFEHAPIGIALGQPGVGWVQVNPAMELFLGRTNDQLRNNSNPIDFVQGITHPEDLPESMRLLTQLAEGRVSSYTHEKRYVRPGGEVRWGHHSAAASRDAQGKLRYIISLVADITPLKQAEEQLRESEERFRIAFEQAPIGISLATPERGIIQVNPAFAQFMGRSREDLLSWRDMSAFVRQVSDPAEFEKNRVLFERVLAGESDGYQMEKRYFRPDGTMRWGFLSVAASRHADGSLRYLVSQVVDITALKQAEQALREREASLAAAQRLSGIGSWEMIVTDPANADNNPLVWSDQSYKILGYEPGSVDATLPRFYSHVHPGDVERLRQAASKARAEGTPYTIVHRMIRADGAERITQQIAEIIRDPVTGQTLKMLGAIQDITDRQRMERDLRDSEARLSAAQHLARLGSWELELASLSDLSRNTLRWSDEVFTIFGYAPGSVAVNLDLFFRHVHPEDLARVQDARAYLENSTAFHVFDHRIVRADGEERIVREMVEIVRDSGTGRVTKLTGAVQDITEQTRLERSLRDSEANLAAAQRIAHMGSWVLDMVRPDDFTGNPLTWSDEVFRILGYEPGRVRPTPDRFMRHVHLDDLAAVRQWQADTLARLQPSSMEHRIVREDGTLRVVIHHRDFVIDPETGRLKRLMGTLQDITDKKDLEQKLLQTQKLESLGLLAGGIAHDFNNLLTGILGYASLAQQDLPAGSAVRQYLAQIDSGSRRAAELCQQMLAYAGRGRVDVRRFSVNDIVRDTLPLLEVSISKRVKLLLRLADALPSVEADATQVRQILMNLVTNASDAIGDADGRIAISTGQVTADRAYLEQTYLAPELPSGEYVFLEVSDTGAGMTAEVQARIFDPFFTTKFTGRGLGLAAVLGIVRAHHGALKVYSEPGRGSTFRLLLPASSGPAAALPVPASAPGWMGSGTALVIDDEPVVRNVAMRMLETCGFTVLGAGNGQEGLELYRGHRGDIRLVLLDLTMPGMSGEETYRALLAGNPEAPVVLMSGFTQGEALDRIPGHGAAAFLQKPFSLAALRQSAQNVVEGIRGLTTGS